MNGFTDYHAHFVYGVDDGARTREDMYAMLDAAAADGVSRLFATSHSTPGMEPFPQEIYDRHLALAREYCREKGTLGQTSWVLVEFVPDVTAQEVETALREITGAGYRILLAHIERYPCLKKHGLLQRLRQQYHIRCQVNCSTVLQSGFWLHRQLDHWFRAGLVDAISSDAHNCASRPTRMQEAYQKLCGWVGETAAQTLTGLDGREFLV